MINADIKKTKINLEINLQNNSVYNDPIRLKQILVNIIGNSIKFTDEGIIAIKISEYK